MITNKKPFCTVPFRIGFNSKRQTFRDCCAKTSTTQLTSKPGESFSSWWNSKELNAFRQELTTHKWPDACLPCKLQEKERNFSFRMAANKEDDEIFDYSWPRAWNIKFGNVCNLACWTCSENSSSVILQHKIKAGITLETDHDPNQVFLNQWPQLEADVLRSYEHHETVTLTLLGGEPLYNKHVISFLRKLIELDLAKRTKLEFHTNGTVLPSKIFSKIEANIWKYLCIFVSLDASGKFVEWLRYGASWEKIKKNIQLIKNIANYVEIHCTLSVLNINHLYQLEEYASRENLKLNVNCVTSPNFMALAHWDLPKKILLVRPTHDKYQTYYDLIGSDPIKGSSEKLKEYIQKFAKIRKPLSDFDPDLAKKMEW